MLFKYKRRTADTSSDFKSTICKMNSGQRFISALMKALVFAFLTGKYLHCFPFLSDLKENIALLDLPIPILPNLHLLSLLQCKKK